MALTRRSFVKCSAAGVGLAATSLLRGAEQDSRNSLSREVGITTGSFMRHLSTDKQPDKLRLLDLPQIMRDELDMHVLDLMTATLASFEPGYLNELRASSEKYECIITNLKMNQKGVELASEDDNLRRKSLNEYKQTIDVAQRLGCRWVRPLPGTKVPDRDRLVAGYRELIDYAAPKGISLLLENFGWIQNRPEVIPTMVK